MTARWSSVTRLFRSPRTAARTGLDTFENGQRASHVGPPSIDTVIGHSYGSTVVGAAASGGHHLDADNVIAVGSPGMLVDRAGRLNLNAGAGVYVMRADNDVIGMGGVVTEWTLGADPTAPGFGAKRLAADPGPPVRSGFPASARTAATGWTATWRCRISAPSSPACRRPARQ